MGRHQIDLEQLCYECYNHVQSGLCTHCGKYIHQDMGRHVVCFHLDLAQLWRCLVSWCTAWRGTQQDCIDHMRRAHTVPAMVKASNLARWFPLGRFPVNNGAPSYVHPSPGWPQILCCSAELACHWYIVIVFLVMRVPMSPSVVLIWLDFGCFLTLLMLRVCSPIIYVPGGSGGGP